MNTVNASTGFSPFQLKTGQSPCVIPPLVPLPADATPAEISAYEVLRHLEFDVQEAQDNLTATKVHQAYHANEKQADEIPYKVGDLVMLSTTHCRCNYKHKGKKRVAKFMPRFDGLYEVMHTFPEKSIYTLWLPNNPTSYPGFHASLLKPFIPNGPTLFPNCTLVKPGIVVTEDGSEETLIDKIVNARRRGRGIQYLVRWVGFGNDHNEWLSHKALEDTTALDVWEAENGTEV
jgi:hypothetical protein